MSRMGIEAYLEGTQQTVPKQFDPVENAVPPTVQTHSWQFTLKRPPRLTRDGIASQECMRIGRSEN